MRPRLHIELVTTHERAAAAAEFLEGFGCELQPGHQPLRIIRRGDEMIGVSQIIAAPIHVTCWSPQRSHRDVVEGINALRLMQEGSTPGGATYCTAHDDGHPFTTQVMGQLGFQDTGLRIFVSNQK